MYPIQLLDIRRARLELTLEALIQFYAVSQFGAYKDCHFFLCQSGVGTTGLGDKYVYSSLMQSIHISVSKLQELGL